jgi:AcrR family transcriptional regulator
MTDSEPHRQLKTNEDVRPGKRDRLVSAARELIYHQGVEKTTIADIASAADVPVGNVYYYFKTKDDIVQAVIESHVQGIEATIESIDHRYRTPNGRLKAIVRTLAAQSESIAQFGCPHGTLCSELDKGGPDPSVARLLEMPIEWAEQQFREMGRSDARELAVELIVTYQGTAALTHGLGDPAVLKKEARRLSRWIDTLAPSK